MKYLTFLLAFFTLIGFTGCDDFMEFDKNETEMEILFDQNGTFIEVLEQEQAQEQDDDDSEADDDEVNESAVPQIVKDELNARYPNATVNTWEMDGANYEAEIESESGTLDVVISANGGFLYTETEIEVDALPQGVKDYLDSTYDKYEIEEADKRTSSTEAVQYVAEVEVEG